MNNPLIKKIEEQQIKIDALEYLITKINLDPIINDLDYFINRFKEHATLKEHRATLIEVWEKINIPYKWEEE